MTKGAIALAKELGMEVTMEEKFAKGTKDFNILIKRQWPAVRMPSTPLPTKEIR
ncbi:MAG: hypothetical protein R3E68_07610 [Burkholderiaceae bacterium]